MGNDSEDNVPKEVYVDFETCIKTVLESRKRPLLIMFYSDIAGEIRPHDLDALEDLFDSFCKKKNIKKIQNLDLLIHTRGGDANTSYRLIQLIRTYCDNLTALIPVHSHSGGTLICFGSNQILMGRSATLSPIDVQLANKSDKGFPLLSIEKYVEFIDDCCQRCNLNNEKNRTYLITRLLEKLVDQIPVIDLGNLYRLRGLTKLHAKTLLHDYMFKDESEKSPISSNIVSRFSRDSPTHSFLMDYNLVKQTGLKVDLLDAKVYKSLKQMVYICRVLKRKGKICPFLPNSDKSRMPFYYIFDGNREVKKNGKK